MSDPIWDGLASLFKDWIDQVEFLLEASAGFNTPELAARTKGEAAGLKRAAMQLAVCLGKLAEEEIKRDEAFLYEVPSEEQPEKIDQPQLR